MPCFLELGLVPVTAGTWIFMDVWKLVLAAVNPVSSSGCCMKQKRPQHSREFLSMENQDFALMVAMVFLKCSVKDTAPNTVCSTQRSRTSSLTHSDVDVPDPSVGLCRGTGITGSYIEIGAFPVAQHLICAWQNFDHPLLAHRHYGLPLTNPCSWQDSFCLSWLGSRVTTPVCCYSWSVHACLWSIWKLMARHKDPGSCSSPGVWLEAQTMVEDKDVVLQRGCHTCWVYLPLTSWLPASSFPTEFFILSSHKTCQESCPVCLLLSPASFFTLCDFFFMPVIFCELHMSYMHFTHTGSLSLAGVGMQLLQISGFVQLIIMVFLWWVYKMLRAHEKVLEGTKPAWYWTEGLVVLGNAIHPGQFLTITSSWGGHWRNLSTLEKSIHPVWQRSLGGELLYAQRGAFGARPSRELNPLAGHAHFYIGYGSLRTVADCEIESSGGFMWCGFITLPLK